jgi:hypothetical protein
MGIDMNGRPLDPLSQMLGEMNAKLDMVAKTQAEDRVASAQYRTDMRRDLGEVRDLTSDLKNRVNNTADELAELRPDVEDYRKHKHQIEGASKLTKIVWTVLSFFGVGGLIAMLEMFRNRGR